MKKLAFSFMAVSLGAISSSVYAAFPTTAGPFQVVVPNLKSGLELTLEGLYLQPTNSDLVYSTATSKVLPLTDAYIASVKPKYDFGFRVGFGYIFPHSGNDAQLSWTHFDHHTSAANGFFPASVQSPWFQEVDASDTSFKYDAVDLDVGQYLSVGSRLQARLFVGVRGTQLKNNMVITNTDLVNGQPRTDGVATLSTVSKFIGIGPRVGIDTSYHVGGCFGVVAHFATALLAGNVDSSGVFTEAAVKGGDQFRITTDTQTRVVPAFDAKLGVDYSIPFKNNSSSLGIEAGYQVTQYVNAIDRVHFSANRFNGITTSSVGFNGPYLSVNFKR